jgi:hypothetical protein
VWTAPISPPRFWRQRVSVVRRPCLQKAALISDPSTLKERISRLLEPLPLNPPRTRTMTWAAVVVIRSF